MPPTPSPESSASRVALDLGLGVLAVLALLCAWVLLRSPDLGLDPGGRAAVLVLLALVFLRLAGRELFDRETGGGPLPVSRMAFAGVGLFFFAWSVYDLGESQWIPLMPWGLVLTGGALLGASVCCDSVLFSLLGAELLDGQLGHWVGIGFGFSGGFQTTAIYFHLGVAALELPLGWWLAHRARRALGLGILANAGWSAIAACLVLGAFGPEFHHWPEGRVPFYVFFLLALLGSILLARVLSRLGAGGTTDLAGRGVILAIHFILVWWGVAPQLAFVIGTLAYHALEANGVLKPEPVDEGPTEVPLEAMENPQSLAEFLLQRLKAQDPAAARLEPPRQAAVVSWVLGLTALAWGALAAVGYANRALPAGDAFRMRIGSLTIEGTVEVGIRVERTPADLERGEPLDCYLVPDRLEHRVLGFSEMVAVRRGEPPPEGIEPGTAWRVPGRLVAWTTADGRMEREARRFGRTVFRLPRGWVDEVNQGDVLVFSEGALGFAWPSRIERGGKPLTTAGSWLR